MKSITKEIHKIRIGSDFYDLFILVISFAFTAIIAFGFSRLSLTGNFFIYYSFSAIFLFYLLRWEVLKIPLKSGRSLKNLIIVGDGRQGREIALNLNNENGLGIKLAGIITNDFNFEDELKALLLKGKVDEILISINSNSYNEIFNAIDICGKYRIPVKLCSELFQIIPQKIKVKTYYGIPVIDVTAPKRASHYSLFKRIIDIIIASAALLILSPLIIILAAIIKLTSKGPIIYSQQRVGLNGRLFEFYKFRSMYVNAGEDEKRKAMMLDFMVNNNACKIVDENRVTAIGRFIRKTSLDELPQLYNVLRGDMSIVGPRPCLRYEYERYSEWQKRRVHGMPGCTGIWQVSGRSSVSFNDSIVLDLYYLIKMSPMYDVKLILKTIPVMLFSRGGK